MELRQDVSQTEGSFGEHFGENWLRKIDFSTPPARVLEKREKFAPELHGYAAFMPHRSLPVAASAVRPFQ